MIRVMIRQAANNSHLARLPLPRPGRGRGLSLLDIINREGEYSNLRCKQYLHANIYSRMLGCLLPRSDTQGEVVYNTDDTDSMYGLC